MRTIHWIGLAAIVFSGMFAAGCKDSETARFPSVDKPTAGIFLEEEVRTALPEGVPLRKVYDKGLALTKESEGFRSHLYNDAADFCTIAYGHLVKHAPCNGSEPEAFLDGVSEPEGAKLLRTDMATAERVVTAAVKPALTDGQYAALCDFVYNVGGGNFRSSTLLAVINEDRFDHVPIQLRRWVKAGGRVLEGLKKRREREIELFFEDTGIPRAMPGAEMELAPVDIRQGES